MEKEKKSLKTQTLNPSIESLFDEPRFDCLKKYFDKLVPKDLMFLNEKDFVSKASQNDILLMKVFVRSRLMPYLRLPKHLQDDDGDFDERPNETQKSKKNLIVIIA